ncbi:small acid-soluble spore protein Tlp [Paenibacillus sp. TRM 82003]|nr:small acid-soluble spore protein Tlp [Paenibacillus sp. TRM 82003]
MAKPDNREDNVAHLQEMTKDTLRKIEETKDYLEEFGDEISSGEAATLKAKNERRKESVQKFRSELKDEARDNE